MVTQTRRAFDHADLAQLEALNAWQKVRWWPVRRRFGIASFGVNVFGADAGETIVIAHREGAGDRSRAHGGHEELYVVLSGRATFVVDGEELDAPVGTFIYVSDPAAERSATAREPGTTVLAVGGKPGTAFTASPWEFASAAVPHHRNGDFATALEVIEEGLRTHTGNAGLLYDVACLSALAGDLEGARRHLDDAVAVDPELAARAADDPDLRSLQPD
jgi:hypothetical protein